MIGQTIESRPRLPLGAIFWLMAASLMDVFAVRQANVHVAIGSLLPWLIAILFWQMRERSFTARFTETALESEEPPLEMRYAELQGLLAPRRPANPFKAGPRCYLIQAIHSGGIVRIPARLNVPSDEVFSFLYGRFPPSGSREVPSKLVDFLRHREGRFGPEQVWTYRARAHLGRSNRHPQLKAFFLALTLAAAVWLVLGIFLVGRVLQMEDGWGWIGLGAVGLMFGGLILLLLWSDGRRNFSGIRRWQQCGLVVAPDGLALVQGDLVGELRWDEVQDVKIGNSPAAFQFTTSTQPPRGIVIKVEGAIIVIADVYDRPLPLIYQNIRHYWQGQPHDDDWDREALPRRSTEGIRPME
ncbi:MAG TPA: hypothetical protein VMF69_10845 [Gemmataceae bacterium]|nr:hypothetical protein [Gemmataceae bacterium]